MAPRGEGAFCSECFSPWRVALKDEVRLSFMAVWFRTPANAPRFKWIVLAWASLRREGLERVKKDKLDQRIDSLRWMASHKGWPLDTFFVRMLGAQPLTTCADPRRFVTMCDEPGRQSIGYMDEATRAFENESVVTVQRPPTAHPLWLGFSVLRTEDEAQVARFAEASRAAEVVSQVATQAVTDATPDGFTRKVSAMLDMVRAKVLEDFAKAFGMRA